MSEPILRRRLRHWRRGFESLGVRNFRLFWLGQVVSLTGTWMQTTAQAWLVLKLANDSPFTLGSVITLQFLPIMLLVLLGGVLADRIKKRTGLAATQTLLMIQAFIFAALVGAEKIQIWQIYVLAVTQGLISALDNPLRQAFVFELVGRERLVNAIGLNSMSFHGARLFGPALAGIMIQFVGIAPALLLNAISFIPVIGALLVMDEHGLFPAEKKTEGNLVNNLKDGFRYAFHTPIVAAVLVGAAFIGTFGLNFSVIVPLVAKNILHLEASGYGMLSAAMGTGALTAALLTAYAREIKIGRMLFSGAGFAIFLGFLAFSKSLPLSLVVMVLVGFFGITCTTAINSLLQLTTPPALRGRVMSINLLFILGSTPVGAFFLGSLGEVAGVPVAIATCALLCMFGIGLAASYYYNIPARGSAPKCF